MKSVGTTIVDGQTYRDGEEIWDLGSLVCTGTDSGGIRHYEGLAKDKDKLPHYVETGSSFLSSDTHQFFKYEATTDTWYEWTGGTK